MILVGTAGRLLVDISYVEITCSVTEGQYISNI